MNKLFILSSILTILLGACSGNVKGSWSCPVLGGGKGNCVSISEADNAKSVDNDVATLSSALPEGYTQKQQKIETTLFAPKLKDLEKITNENKLNLNLKLVKLYKAIHYQNQLRLLQFFKLLTLKINSAPKKKWVKFGLLHM